MLSGAPPFYSQDKNKMIEDRLNKPIEMPLFFSKEAISLINGLAAIEVILLSIREWLAIRK